MLSDYIISLRRIDLRRSKHGYSKLSFILGVLRMRLAYTKPLTRVLRLAPQVEKDNPRLHDSFFDYNPIYNPI